MQLDPAGMTAIQLAQAVREGRLGVEELVRYYLARIAEFDGPEGLNAVGELNEKVLPQARRMDTKGPGEDEPLFGLPILIKDNIDVRGLYTTAGSLALADNIARRDALVVARLKRRGALILGKTHMTEFANYTGEHMPGGYSSQGGQVKNAYDREKSPSGSSSGSAVAVSAGFCAAALGTDTSFSIVGCATDNGVTGLKPAHNALSGRGIVPIARTLDSAGPITCDLKDALLIYSCMRKSSLPPVVPLPPKELRLAVNTFDRDQVSDRQLGLYEAVLEPLRRDGARVMEVSHPYTPLQREVMRCEFRRDLEDYLAHSAARRLTLQEIVAFYESDPERMMKYGDAFLRGALAAGPQDEAYGEALRKRRVLRGQMLRELKGYDACLMTGPTNIMHFTGLPSLALRLAMGTDNTPRGMILYGADEARLFAAALTIEQYCQPVPPPRL